MPQKYTPPASAEVMSSFYDLSSLDVAARVKAAAQILHGVYTSQKDEPHAQGPVLKYCLKRLVKGLSSDRDGARQGYAMALVELLRMVEIVTPIEVLAMAHELIEAGGRNANLKDQRNAYFGRIFAYTALSSSGRLAESDAAVTQVLTHLLDLGSKKSYLTELCSEAEYDCINAARTGTLKALGLAPLLRERINATPVNSVLITLLLTLERRDVALGDLMPAELKHGKIVDVRNFAALSKLLCANVRALPNLPRAWKLLVDSVLKTDSPAILQEFWKVMVEDALFDSNLGTATRKALGFQLFSYILPQLSAAQIPIVFPRSFLRAFITSLASETTYLHPAANLVCDQILKVASSSEDDSIRLALVGQLVGENGSPRFDSITKTKTVSGIIAQLSLEGVTEYVDQLQERFVGGEADDHEAAVHSQRAFIIDQLVALVKNSKVPRDEIWPVAVAKFLFVQANCTEGEEDGMLKVPAVPLEERTRELCHTRFRSVITELSSYPPVTEEGAASASAAADGKVAYNLEGTVEGGDFRIADLVKFVAGVQKNKAVTFATPLAEDAVAMLAEVEQLVEQIHKKTRTRKRKDKNLARTHAQSKAYELLLLHVALEVYSDPASTVPVLKDLVIAYPEIMGKAAAAAAKAEPASAKKASRKAAAAAVDAADDDDDGEEHDSTEVLLGILLNFLSQPSASLRSVVARVFKVFSGQLSKSAVALLIEVVEQEGSGLEVDEEEEDVEDGPPDGEDGDGEDGSASNDSDDSDEDGDDVGDDAAPTITPEQRAQLQAALGTKEAGDDDDSDDDGNLSDWDDEAMIKADEALAVHFRNLQGSHRKKQALADRKAAIDFKMRVLELIDSFVKQQSNSPHIVDLIQPLVEATQVAESSAGSKALVDRISGVLRRLTSIKEYVKGEQLPVAACHELLPALFTLALKGSAQVASSASHGVLFLVKILRGGSSTSDAGAAAATPARKAKGKGKGKDKKTAEQAPKGPEDLGSLDIKAVATLYGDAFADFMAKKNRVKPALFLQLCRMQPAVGWHVASGFVDGITNGTNEFLRGQAMVLVQELMQRRAHAACLPNAATAVGKVLNTALAASSAQLAACAVAGTDPKMKYVRAALGFTMAAVKAVNKTGGTIKDGKKVQASLKAVLESKLATKSPPVKTIAMQVSRLVAGGSASAGGESAKPAKRKATEAAAEEVPEEQAVKDTDDAAKLRKKKKSTKKKK